MFLAAQLSSHKLRAVPDQKLRLAAQVVAGGLERHPVVNGLFLAAMEKCSRSDSGTKTMRKCNLDGALLGVGQRQQGGSVVLGDGMVSN